MMPGRGVNMGRTFGRGQFHLDRKVRVLFFGRRGVHLQDELVVAHDEALKRCVHRCDKGNNRKCWTIAEPLLIL